MNTSEDKFDKITELPDNIKMYFMSRIPKQEQDINIRSVGVTNTRIFTINNHKIDPCINIRTKHDLLKKLY